MSTESTQPVTGVQGWHSADHAPLVTAKGWKTADDALASYGQLESHMGAPATHLIRIPSDATKIDDTFRSDVFKRIGYNPSRAPEKAEDYGVNFEGAPPEFSTEIFKLAHKHGMPKEALADFAAFNTKFGKDFAAKQADADKVAADARWNDRRSYTEGKLKERFGDKMGDMTERMTREAMRLGFKDAAALEQYERGVSYGGDEDLHIFRNMLADIAELRREAPLHKGASQAMTAETAASTLKSKSADKEWVGKALTRGTPEAEENLRLNFLASGGEVNDEQIARLAKGLSAQPNQ